MWRRSCPTPKIEPIRAFDGGFGDDDAAGLAPLKIGSKEAPRPLFRLGDGVGVETLEGVVAHAIA